MTDLLRAALSYASRAWPVFPLMPREKRPLGSLVPHGLHEASTDRQMISGWWNQCPDANVGIRTGVAFDVVDVDGRTGADALVKFTADRKMTAGPQAWTGSGWHLLHEVTGLGNRTRILPGVDFRGKGGYIVAPPSIHPNGTLYTWDSEYTVDQELEPLPSWMLTLLDPPVPERTQARPFPHDERLTAYARRALESELAGVTLAPVGSRNDALNRAAFSLGQLVAGGALDENDVIAALANAARGAGLGELETRRSIVSGLRSGAKFPRTVSVPA